MDYARRNEILAEMGLRLILEAYKGHPTPMPLSIIDDLELRLKDDATPGERGRQHLAGEMRHFMKPLADSMISDGVFRSRQGPGDSISVTISAHVRSNLQKTVAGDVTRADTIRHALEKVHGNYQFERGGFIGLAREIGFEP